VSSSAAVDDVDGHVIEEHVKVYLVRRGDRWVIDPVSDDGYPLDGLEGGPCCNVGHGCDLAHPDDSPALPTMRQLLDLMQDHYLR